MEDILSRAPMFSALDDEAATALRTSMTPVNVHKGQQLFHEGDPGERMFIITEGKIKLGNTAPDGREGLLAILGPSELLGELSLFDPGPRTATATALTDSTLLALHHSALRPWLAGRPEVAEALLRALAQRLRRTNDQMADLVFSDVPGRVAKTLIELGDKFGQEFPDGIHVTHDMTQEELAQLVGASRETVNKALAEFASRGWVRLESRSVVIIEPDKLQRRSG